MKIIFPYFTILFMLVLACKEKQESPESKDGLTLFKTYFKEISNREELKNESMVILLSNYSCNSCNKIILKHLKQKNNNQNIKLIFTGYNSGELNKLHLFKDSFRNDETLFFIHLKLKETLLPKKLV